MKKVVLFILLVVGSFSSVIAQNSNPDLIGRWKLETVEVEGETAPAEKVFGNEAYQEYSSDGIFASEVGGKKSKGTYEFSEKEETITVTTSEGSNTFNLVSLEEEKMSLEFETPNGNLILNYVKQ